MLAVLSDVWGRDESTEPLGRNTAGHLYLFEPDNTEKSEMDQMYQSVTSITHNLPLLR